MPRIASAATAGRAFGRTFTSRTRRSVSIVSTTHSTAYARSTSCTPSRNSPFEASTGMTPGHSSAASTASTTSSHITIVAVRPMRPSLRLPARDCADPGIRKFRTTSHQARRVITCGERVSGRRIGWLPMITSPEPAARPDDAADAEAGCRGIRGGADTLTATPSGDGSSPRPAPPASARTARHGRRCAHRMSRESARPAGPRSSPR